jgi:hypothetical protein
MHRSNIFRTGHRRGFRQELRRDIDSDPASIKRMLPGLFLGPLLLIPFIIAEQLRPSAMRRAQSGPRSSVLCWRLRTLCCQSIAAGQMN